MKKISLVITLLALCMGVISAQVFVFGDALPDAPELAPRGEYNVGVRALTLTNADQIDILSLSEDNPDARYDRELFVEVWYPATLADGEEQMIMYDDNLGRADQDNLVPFAFEGRATRDAEINADGAPYPLVVVSHGYPGSAYMMTYLTENLASKGYVVVSIAHTESTFTDVTAFGSTLLNRSRDQIFVIDEMARLNSDETSFLNDLVDAENTAVIGYSMGGYGALNTIGAGYNAVLQNFIGDVALPIMAGTAGYAADDRVKASVLFAPWGGDLSAVGAPGVGLWDAEALADIEVPTLWVAGSEDDVAIYDGIVNLFNNAVNSERYLLTYQNALHNVAPNPPPYIEDMSFGDYERYNEPAFGNERINNVNQHFVTAFLDLYLKGNETMSDYLNLDVEFSNDGVYATDDEGNFTEEHTYWMGFPNRTALGMFLQRGE
jgi:alpha-beta hydrolase superfamily lysophospholipase